MAARRRHDEAGRQLGKDHGGGRDRREARRGTGAPAEGIQRVAPGQEQEHDQPRTEHNDPTGRGHALSVTNRRFLCLDQSADGELAIAAKTGVNGCYGDFINSNDYYRQLNVAFLLLRNQPRPISSKERKQ
jgi:hypothetical protein